MSWSIPNLVLHDKSVRLANMRTHGRRHVFVNCGNPDCYHNTELDVSGFPDDVTFGHLQPPDALHRVRSSRRRRWPVMADWSPQIADPLVHAHFGLLQPIYKRFPLDSDFCLKCCSDSFVEHQQLVDRP